MSNTYDIKLAEKPIVEKLNQDAYVIVAQEETVGTEKVEAIRRVPLATFIEGLNETGMMEYPDIESAPSTIYYGCVTNMPSSEESVEAMSSSEVCEFTIPAGRYFFACKSNPKTIKDKNGFDQSTSFESAMIGDYYAFFYEHTTVVSMKFTVNF